MGKVYLVGAGPGDPGLLTVKAMRLLREADLIVYDYLSNPEHLRHAKDSAVKLCVGKGFRHRLYSQEKVNRMIIRAAKKGRTVVRLKGGDPYLFGRGGEEALYLRRHRIPFEVIPGVTSATACAAYAGVPLTHRDHNASVTFLTGHRADDERLDTVPWPKIASLGGTLVIYMGFYNLAKIAERLVRAGMDPRTPVCVIEWGTLPRQRSCDGTLTTIASEVRRRGFGAPCIIVVGEVVSLRRKLDWFERQPLFGKTIVVTRMQEKAGALTERFRDLGAHVVEFPVIEIKPAADRAPMDQAIRDLPGLDWLIFTSTYGVDAFFERLEKRHLDARALSGVKVACVGPATAAALAQKGVRADLVPAQFDTAALLQAFKKRAAQVGGKDLLLLRTDIAPPFLEEGLRKMGARVRRVTAYRTRPVRLSAAAKRGVLGGKVDWVVFTSSSTVESFVKAVGRAGARRLARSGRLASIGPVTSRTIRSFGLKVGCEARVSTIEGLVDSLRRKDR